LTQTEVVDAAARIVAAVRIPVLVDIDTGYGNAFNVERTVRELVQLGAAAASSRTRSGRSAAATWREAHRALEETAEARGGSRDGGPDFWITARTDARAVEGIDEAIRRGRAFVDHGASCVFVEAPSRSTRCRRSARRYPRACPSSRTWSSKGRRARSATELAAAGYRPCSCRWRRPRVGARARTLSRRSRATARRALGDRMLAFGELNVIVGLDEKYRRERGRTA
jgi:methylisocitrate lyase